VNSKLRREMPVAIKKQEFYEGAALHQLACNGHIRDIGYEAPFFLLNRRWLLLLKYCTKTRSPWSFTFSPSEHARLQKKAIESEVVIGLICGSDGVAALNYDSYSTIAGPCGSAIRIACSRRHGQHYAVNGPDGTLDEKIPPSRWKGLISFEGALRETS
jgi:hypothetical protein